jgi:hypothetical protein
MFLIGKLLALMIKWSKIEKYIVYMVIPYLYCLLELVLSANCLRTHIFNTTSAWYHVTAPSHARKKSVAPSAHSINYLILSIQQAIQTPVHTLEKKTDAQVLFAGIRLEHEG